ncbi:MAG: flagellar hook-basal body complex protein [Pseudomonadota bacterium]
MFGGIFNGLSGMQAFSSGLRQVSNNITNLNTSGFKGSSVLFNNLYSSGGNGLSFNGGVDAKGGGVELSVSQLDLSAGELRQTGRDLDLAIDGPGFLVLERDGELFYTRTGSFEVQADGSIVLSGTDLKLTFLDERGIATPLSIDEARSSAPEATTTISLSGNLSSTADDFSLANVGIFDANGEEANWTFDFSRVANGAPGEWSVNVIRGDGTTIGTETLNFTGGIVGVGSEILTFTDPDSGQAIDLDLSTNVTSFSSGSVSTLQVSESDGYGLGQITSLRVGNNGVMEVGYSNEQTTELGALALALFADPQSLEQREGSLFSHNLSSGRELVTSLDERAGIVLSGRIEASNVDLSQQFGDLILVQRGFQASSQVVSISNDMIQQLFGIRGQG